MTHPRYVHDETIHSCTDPEIIVPVLVDLLRPQSVVDVGCGIGTFLAAFKRQGILDVLGIDGEWVQQRQVLSNLEPNEFLPHDLESPIKLSRTFSLALCLEVVEHLSPQSAKTIVHTLVSLADIVVFSAAIPGQGGQNHINEQPLSYWEALFHEHDYHLHDFLRPLFWDNSSIRWWYRQNIVVFAKGGITPCPQRPRCVIHSLVHPELYKKRVHEMTAILSGSGGLRLYGRLFIKSALRLFASLLRGLRHRESTSAGTH